MRKRSVKKLVLVRETLKRLEPCDLPQVVAGNTSADTFCLACNPDSVLPQCA